MSKRPTYLKAVVESLGTMLKGMRLTAKHYVKGYERAAPLGISDPNYFAKTEGPITISYPQEKVPVPDNGRYRLFMETDDCIGCDKCARICPVDCITIETFRADGDLGRTSDGTVKRLHLPTFDIDMAKCMYCGLCTTVCPTECLTMTPVYDYSEYDRDNFLYHFGAYSPEDEGRIRQETEAALAEKKAAKAVPTSLPVETAAAEAPAARPRPRPMIKPSEAPVTAEDAPILPSEESKNDPPAPPRPRPRPVMKPKPDEAAGQETQETAQPLEAKEEAPPAESATPRPRPRPIMQPKVAPAESETESADAPPITPTPETPVAKPRPRPIMQPKVAPEVSDSDAPVIPVQPAPIEGADTTPPPADAPPAPKPRPRPIMKPKVADAEELSGSESESESGSMSEEKKDGGPSA
jgi:formate hydrogenlyase subunit 6/NADH:ubiquinone oxidoreductase subunit I